MTDAPATTVTPTSQTPAAAVPESSPPSAQWYGAPEFEAIVTEQNWSGPADVIKAYQQRAADQSGMFAPPPADADASTWAAAMRKLGAPSSCRMSFYLYNTTDDAERGVEAVRDAIEFFTKS